MNELSYQYPRPPSTKDAALVTHLREAGAVFLGKASLSELEGVMTTMFPGFNAVSGMGKNPYGKKFPVWDSSSGSAISKRKWV